MELAHEREVRADLAAKIAALRASQARTEARIRRRLLVLDPGPERRRWEKRLGQVGEWNNSLVRALRLAILEAERTRLAEFSARNCSPSQALPGQ